MKEKNQDQRSRGQQEQQDQQRLREQQQQRQGGGGMRDLSQLKEHMEVVDAGGAHVGTVDKVEGNRIKLTKRDNSAGHTDHHHYIDANSIAAIEGNKVRLSTSGGSAAQQEKGGEAVGGPRS